MVCVFFLHFRSNVSHSYCIVLLFLCKSPTYESLFDTDIKLLQ